MEIPDFSNVYLLGSSIGLRRKDSEGKIVDTKEGKKLVRLIEKIKINPSEMYKDQIIFLAHYEIKDVFKYGLREEEMSEISKMANDELFKRDQRKLDRMLEKVKLNGNKAYLEMYGNELRFLAYFDFEKPFKYKYFEEDDMDDISDSAHDELTRREDKISLKIIDEDVGNPNDLEMMEPGANLFDENWLDESKFQAALEKSLSNNQKFLFTKTNDGIFFAKSLETIPVSIPKDCPRFGTIYTDYPTIHKTISYDLRTFWSITSECHVKLDEEGEVHVMRRFKDDCEENEVFGITSSDDMPEGIIYSPNVFKEFIDLLKSSL